MARLTTPMRLATETNLLPPGRSTGAPTELLRVIQWLMSQAIQVVGHGYPWIVALMLIILSPTCSYKTTRQKHT